MAEFVAASGGETEQQFQQYLSTLYAQSSPGMATTGVLYGMPVAQTTTASGSVTVDVGAGVVQASVNAGAAPVINPTLKTQDILVANPMGSVTRNDIVVFDTATTPPAIHAIIGAPNTPPTDPTIPSSCLPLARVRQAASATTITAAQIDDLRTFTGPAKPPNIIQAITPAANFSNPPSGYSNLTLAVSGRVAILTGHASWVSGTGGGLTLAQIPTPYWPLFDTAFTCVSQNNSTGAMGTTYRGVVTAANGAVVLSWMGSAQSTANVIPVQATWLVA